MTLGVCVCVSHSVKHTLPRLAPAGDTVLGYDTANLQVVALDFEAFVGKGGVVPDVVLVRKSYEVSGRPSADSDALRVTGNPSTPARGGVDCRSGCTSSLARSLACRSGGGGGMPRACLSGCGSCYPWTWT